MPSTDNSVAAWPPAGPGRSRRPLALGLGVLVLSLGLMTGAYALRPGDSESLPTRRAAVKERGTSVMPFDLDRTRHVFTEQPDGGEQSVTVLDPGDVTQILLIRRHLTEEAAKFSAGDFADPAAIHGDDMPGLAELRAGSARITVSSTDLPDGASLRYSSDDPVLVQGIHSWFKAQTMDHGGSGSHPG